MAPTYKVIYFPIMGLGESIRYLLSYGEVEFEDERIPMEEWKNHKADMPFGQMPILEVDGKRAHQSVAIVRYLAKQFKLTGNDDWEDLEIDAVVDSVNDFRNKMAEAIKSKRKETFDKETLPYYMDRLDEIAKTNNGHLALGKLTWADLLFASLSAVLKFHCSADIFDGRENLQEVINNVESLPAIKAWIEKRPKSDF